MSEPRLNRNVLTSADLASRRPLAFDLAPARDQRDLIAARLALEGLRKLRFRGRLIPEGRRDWRLEARLGATTVQPCVVTLAPVTSRIDSAVTRRFLGAMPATAPAPGEEAEMPADDTIEPLGREIDLTGAMVEALALALPDYPRAPGAELGAAAVAPDGADPLPEGKTRPFAALADLKRKLDGGT